MLAVTTGSLQVLRNDSHSGQFTFMKSRKTGQAFFANRPLPFEENAEGQTLKKP